VVRKETARLQKVKDVDIKEDSGAKLKHKPSLYNFDREHPVVLVLTIVYGPLLVLTQCDVLYQNYYSQSS
jgi:hypothetical protein